MISPKEIISVGDLGPHLHVGLIHSFLVQVCTLSGISIGSAVFAGLTNVSNIQQHGIFDRQTDHGTSVSIGFISCMHVMRPNNIQYTKYTRKFVERLRR